MLPRGSERSYYAIRHQMARSVLTFREASWSVIPPDQINGRSTCMFDNMNNNKPRAKNSSTFKLSGNTALDVFVWGFLQFFPQKEKVIYAKLWRKQHNSSHISYRQTGCLCVRERVHVRTLCQRTASTEHTVSLHLTNNEGFALYHSTVRVNESWAAWEDCMPRVS